jgi:CheY-like chemotaxis protein
VIGKGNYMSEPVPVPSSQRPLKVLVVDDNEDIAKTTSMLLKLKGYDVATVADGQAAVDAARGNRFDVILMDIGLPILNGYEAARAIRQLPEGNDVRIIAISGWGQDEDRRRSQEAGFDLHLVKPVLPANLFALLEGIKEESKLAPLG